MLCDYNKIRLTFGNGIKMSLTFNRNTILALMMAMVLTMGMGACAKTQDPNASYDSAAISDPIEPVNRGIFAFNNFLDIVLIEPIAKGYNKFVPDFMRDGIQNFMRNLRAPLVVANNLLQGNVKGAGTATARFIINTTAGIGGLIDVASTQGFEYVPEDFGQTLAVWGFGDGMYIVLPVIGPSSVRDTAGLVGDFMADPVRIYAENTENDWIIYTRGAVEAIDTRSRYIKAVRDLRKNSLDYYAAVRSAYAQKRKSLIQNKSVEGETASQTISIPDYDN